MAVGAGHLYAFHDWDTTWAALVKSAAKTSWCVVTEELGDNPNDFSGKDYRYMADYGVSPIVRLNYSHHGEGTIPVPDRYDEFAVRVGNFVRASQGCRHWIIGNEPNIIGERPVKQIPIQPQDYVSCYKMSYAAIKNISLDHRVGMAAIAPYNVDTGWSIDYWRNMLNELGKQMTTTDFINLHTYSRGGDPNSVFSTDKMNWPYNNYYNGFRAYQDFLHEVPAKLKHLRAFITETDQLDPWVDSNSGWVVNAYREIAAWNATPGKIPVDCLALYRWPKFDQWWIVGKNGVLEDFKKSLTFDFKVNSGSTIHLPVVTPGKPYVQVTAPAGVNVRTGPGVDYRKLGAVEHGAILPIVAKDSSQQWWGVTTVWGVGWIYGTLVDAFDADSVPVIEDQAPPPIAAEKIDQDWLIASLSRVLGFDRLVAKAVLAIESAGRSFQDGRMVIRFENHVFYDQVSKLDPQKLAQVSSRFKFGSPIWTGHQWLNPATGQWENQHDGGQAEEWASFKEARKINETAAMRAISMGSAQILGTNHYAVGFPTVQEMFNAYNDPTTGSFNQLTGFFAYVVAAGLVDKIKAKDWRSFAQSYNGSGNVDYYANAMQQKYKELGGK